ncbi:sigma-54-dependent transcriptional regulator [Pacificibacter marinus]|uniref:Regulatory protein LuxO n=1 Tax=Pacificibacter marinus TaxID=658057 RepID=A0A1Y5RBI4_9RHOB|nr:sigma-54 dependent transcriptional regulator [Pacificibacter marinus]SEK24802.1 DNA-binding transcriptional response regulator, NtrC family, contains REC, AAA-type ATPase, and a Fis-type DNA-binding domains [Pacificibacter marinus]SLN13494.1 Regulatory protein LuxO [Pacificibacter marinus]
MPHTPILIIDDNESHIMLYGSVLNDAGFSTICARTSAQAIELARQHNPQIALVDLVLPDGTGNDLVATLRDQNPELRAIVITAYASVDRAVAAMRLGVSDFLVKPVDPQTLLNAVTNARSDRNHSLDPSLMTRDAPPLGGLIGSSRPMKRVYATIRAVAGSVATVFVTGENGTGKTQCAEAIHALSSISDGPFVPVNCGVLSQGDLGSAIFGYASDAQSERDQEKIGAAQMANGGTLFLDEVCELDAMSQARLLQLLQTSSVIPFGSVDAHPVKIRIICASSTDPLEQVKSGKFRADLYYRLHVVPIHLPALRERGTDVIEIAEAMVIRYAAKEKRPTRTLSHDTKTLLQNYTWPGNIRELMNLLWNCVMVSDGRAIEPHHLPTHMRENIPLAPIHTPQISLPTSLQDYLQGKTLSQIEREIIEVAIAQANGSIPQASLALGVSPSTIYRKLETWGLPARRSRKV